MGKTNHLRWGIIGTGNMASNFADSLNNSEDAHLYAVVSRQKEKAASFAAKHLVEKSFGNLNDFLNDNLIDVLYIATPHNTHFEYIIEGLKAQKHIVCEKPITINSTQLEEAIQLANEKNLLLFEAMTIHYMPIYKVVQEYIKSNSLGKLIMIQANYGSFKRKDDLSHYFFDEKLAGGALFDIGVYTLHLASFFLSSPPLEILTLANINEFNVDESSVITLRNPQREIANLVITFSVDLPLQATIAFEKGYFLVENYPRAERIKFVDDKGNSTEIKEGDSSSALAYEINEITKIIKTDEVNRYLTLSRNVLQIMDVIRDKWHLRYSFESNDD